MCGIFGVFGEDAERIAPRARVASSALAHRGPDAEGLWLEAGVFFGHRRLSIIDLDDRANQPMRRGPLTLVYNGEIYNYAAIRSELEATGEKFQTTSDSEVLLAGLVREGIRFLERTEGMFAFAVYDARDRSLLLARDRYGEKPLFVHETSQLVTFASELSGIEALVESRLAEDSTAIALLFRLSYVPAPFSPLAGVTQLEPGTWRRYDVRLSRSEGRYYTLPSSASPRMTGYQAATEALRARLEASVELRMKTADVPVATLLSGGLDSTIITLLAHRLSDKPVRAYSLTFPDDPSFDEGDYAVEAARSAPGLDHRIVPARVSDLLAFSDRLFAKLSEPLADASLVPTSYLMSHIEEKVVLCGDGADEIFAGYGSYASMHLSARLPKWLKSVLLLAPTFGTPARISFSPLRAAALFHANLADELVDEYLNWRSYARPEELLALGLEKDTTAVIRSAVGQVERGTLRDLQIADIAFNLPNDMLRKVDIASMAFGIEARLPYLDRDLVHFALSTPDEFRIKGRVRKRMLRDAFSHIVPRIILERRKMGFLMPIRRWFETGPLKDALLDLARAQTRFDRRTIDRLVDEHRLRVADHSVLLWAMYVYFRWSAGRSARASAV